MYFLEHGHTQLQVFAKGDGALFVDGVMLASVSNHGHVLSMTCVRTIGQCPRSDELDRVGSKLASAGYGVALDAFVEVAAQTGHL